MGMYTEFHYNVELRKDTPEIITEILQQMISGNGVVKLLPDHPLFQTSRWSVMLQCDSYYFAATTYCTLQYDDITNLYFLNIRCNLKNYDNEIEKFCDWIRPFIDKEKGDFLGFSRYEETEIPTLIYA